MSIIPLPGKNGAFLAVRKFWPTFNSAEAEIVWVTPNGKNDWIIEPFISLPYVHRFDIISVGGRDYFVAATLCSSKKSPDDWSDPGKVYVGEIPDSPRRGIELSVIKDGLVKNHGWTKTSLDGRPCGIVTCDSGAYAVFPPQTTSEGWKIELLMSQPISDIAVVDIDGDGEDEFATIEPFHGEIFRIYKKSGNDFSVLYEYPKAMSFGHVVWGGNLCGRFAVIGGYRREGAELFVVTCEDAARGLFQTQTIDCGMGPSNIHVFRDGDRDVILAANRETNSAAVYFVQAES
jgi:hypothetical protein